MQYTIESSHREKRLMAEPRNRALSLGDHGHTVGAPNGPPQAARLALPGTEDVHPLYNDWEIFSQIFRSGPDRTEDHRDLLQPSSSRGNTTAVAESVDAETAAALYRLRCKFEDAMVFRENRAKRTAADSRSHLTPSDATRQQVRESLRTYTIDSESSDNFHGFESHGSMSNSAATIRPNPSTPSPGASPSASPQIEMDFFGAAEWVQSPTFSSRSPDLARSSVSTNRSSISITSNGRLSPSIGLGISTASTTPEHALRSVLSSASLATLSLGDAAFKWTPLCRKVQVERKSLGQVGGKERVIFETHECDVQWKFREDGGMSLRGVYKSKTDGKARLWTTQEFSALGPSIPLTTTIDGEISIDFPRGSFGKLDKHWIDIKYSFGTSEASAAFQTLLYTNNENDTAELLFDRPVRTISSDKNRPECRGRNLRLWKRTEMHFRPEGPVREYALVLLFYTSCLEDKGHWVEEPHYAFESLTQSVYNKTSDKLTKLTLMFSKDPAKSLTSGLLQRRRSSQVSVGSGVPTSPVTVERRDSLGIPGITRTGTGGSTSSSTDPRSSSRLLFGRSKSFSSLGNLNVFEYARLDIEFQSIKDRMSFLEVWKKYPKPQGISA
ncbi:hypothetical protein CC86DRAFT_365782 [Ophiobolus disseminans]|uniref:Uncharacterized protein n=1 Tax=Ophiobolus disseminans TaxID=1469910 RepID=A0A6A7AF47_9PLEO|nr:hypothetical protein CC86DRAFT_365782 [Ophiobolus disseminans]